MLTSQASRFSTSSSVFVSGSDSTSASEDLPQLKQAAPRAALDNLPNAAHQQAHTSSEPKYEARPKTLMGTLLAGAGVGMLITRVMFPGFGEMIVGGMAGAAATSLCYATGVCLLACHRRENGLDALQAQKEIMVVVTSSNSEERDEEIV